MQTAGTMAWPTPLLPPTRRTVCAHLRLAVLFVLACLATLTPAQAIQCYSGAQLQVIQCPSVNCIKQTVGFDTVRYCDGVGPSSICQTYRIFETCETVSGLGQICCCSGNLCNSAPSSSQTGLFVTSVLTLFALFLSRLLC